MSDSDHTPVGRRAFLTGGSLVLATAALDRTGTRPLAAAENGPGAKVRFGLVTDLHYADKPPAGTRHYRETLGKLAEAAGPDRARVLVRRISEEVQKDEPLMATLRRIGALPDKNVYVTRTEDGVLAGSGGETAEIDADSAGHIFVRRL